MNQIQISKDGHLDTYLESILNKAKLLVSSKIISQSSSTLLDIQNNLPSESQNSIKEAITVVVISDDPKLSRKLIDSWGNSDENLNNNYSNEFSSFEFKLQNIQIFNDEEERITERNLSKKEFFPIIFLNYKEASLDSEKRLHKKIVTTLGNIFVLLIKHDISFNRTKISKLIEDMNIDDSKEIIIIHYLEQMNELSDELKYLTESKINCKTSFKLSFSYYRQYYEELNGKKIYHHVIVQDFEKGIGKVLINRAKLTMEMVIQKKINSIKNNYRLFSY